MATTARFIVLWDAPQNPAEFHRHYRDVHIPLVRKLPGLRRYTLSANAATVRGGAPYYRIAELDFDDLPSLRRAFESAEGQVVGADASHMATLARMRSMTYELEDVLSDEGHQQHGL